MRRFDAIVVGAGPAGSTTAYRLARAGVSVLLLDRARFPRDKPCGGGLTLRAVRQLPFSVEAVVEERVDTLELELRYARRFVRRSREPLVLMTQRRRLDAYLVDRAVEAGAELRENAKVTRVAADGRVEVDGETLVASAVVGADGANGVTARSLGLPARLEHGVALEGNVPYEAMERRRYERRAVVSVGVVPGGYAWVFPKGDHVNVGVGGWTSEGPRLRERLRELCVAHAIDESAVTELRGHRLPMRGGAQRADAGRALVVGDAAGIVDPLSGDGMYEAFLSGKLAAEAVLDLLGGRASDLFSYTRALARACAAAEAVSWRTKLAFDRFPAAAFELARLPLSWRLFETVVRGERRASEARGFVAVPLRVLETLGH